MDEELCGEKKAELLEAALKARENAYAPYSRFQVGAALLADDGKIYTGCNVENASYGLAVCAERVAVFQAVLNGARSFRAMAVVAALDEPVPPCGACRQVLAEFAPEMPLFMGNLQGKISCLKVKDLLPYAFGLDKLMEDKG